jgi:hypothetical protein
MRAMMSGFSRPKSKHARQRCMRLAIAGLAALLATTDQAGARSRGNEHAVESIEARNPGEPIMAIVSLQKQRITVYDANGWILRAPVSSGQKGRETPAGIFSVIQKDAEHYSNLYDDAFMPHMQRLTWSGIALHGGALPGYPASHGCIRMAFDFAARLFDVTQLGLRVIVAPADTAPVEINHPFPIQPRPADQDIARARIAEADQASRKADQARGAAGQAYREAMQAMVPLRAAENLKLRAETQFATVEADLGAAGSAEARQQAEDAKAKIAARIQELEGQSSAAKAELQPKLDALAAAREAAVAAETARVAAAETARQFARSREPVSMLISRKTQRLYVRQALEPILDEPVTILDADRPIGTYVFTALERSNGDTGLRWNVVALEGRDKLSNTGDARGHPSEDLRRDAQPSLPGPDSATAALDRIVISQDLLSRIPEMSPRSSVIITDEALSTETGKGTDFVVVLSDAPQGGIKFRRRGPVIEFGDARPRDRLPYWNSPTMGRLSPW